MTVDLDEMYISLRLADDRIKDVLARLPERVQAIRDLAGPFRAEPGRGQLLGRYVDVRWVADVLRPVGERERGALQVVVQRVDGRLAPQIRGLEDVQRLTDGGSAGRRRRHAVHVEPAVVHLGRVLVAHPVPRQVGRGHVPRQ